MSKYLPHLVLSIVLASSTAYAAPDRVSVKDFGAAGDGKTDDTAAFQKALDSMGKAGGGVVEVPRGNYLFKGVLQIPNAVTLAGIWQSVPAHNGIRDAHLPKPTDDGSTLLVTAGRGDEQAAPFLTLHTNSTVKGLVFYYPDQSPTETPAPYPYTLALRGKNPAVLDCELLNPFNAIDATRNERHLIRNVQGQPLRRGVWVDSIYDIGRIENVHWNPWWSVHPKVMQFQMEQGEAFIFEKSDWQYVLNTFCYGYHVGYRFSQSAEGACNGNFLGIGADDCYTAVQVDQASPIGLLITNGEFTAFKGPNPTMVRSAPGNKGSTRFVNCSFWGPCHQVAVLEGGTTGFTDCIFVQWDAPKKGLAAIQATGGSLVVRGCEFQRHLPQVDLGPNVQRAIVSGNLLAGPEQIRNASTGSVVISDNASPPARK